MADSPKDSNPRKKRFYVMERRGDAVHMRISSRVPGYNDHPKLGRVRAVRLDTAIYVLHPAEDLDSFIAGESASSDKTQSGETAMPFLLNGFPFDKHDERLPFVRLWDGYLGIYPWS